MSNLSIISQIQQRVAELKRESALLEGALRALTGKAALKNASAARAKPSTPAEGTFSLTRPNVQACLVSKPRLPRDLVAMLAKRKKATLNTQGERVMWARVYQHLLQLESVQAAKRTPKGWVRLGK